MFGYYCLVIREIPCTYLLSSWRYHSGLGFSVITLDWNQIAFIGSPWVIVLVTLSLHLMQYTSSLATPCEIRFPIFSLSNHYCRQRVGWSKYYDWIPILLLWEKSKEPKTSIYTHFHRVSNTNSLCMYIPTCQKHASIAGLFLVFRCMVQPVHAVSPDLHFQSCHSVTGLYWYRLGAMRTSYAIYCGF